MFSSGAPSLSAVSENNDDQNEVESNPEGCKFDELFQHSSTIMKSELFNITYCNPLRS